MALGALVSAILPQIWPVLTAQVLIGASSSFLAAVALAALFILYFWMPETRGLRGAPADRARG